MIGSNNLRHLYLLVMVLNIAACCSEEVKCESNKSFPETCIIKSQTIDDPLTQIVMTTKVNKLIIWSKSVNVIPELISETFPQLDLFNVQETSVTNLTDRSFKNLTSLIELNIDYNLIDNIDESAFKDLVELKILTLKENKIEFLPPTVFDTLQQLELLDLRKNQIQFLCETTFTKTTNLSKLWLSSNKIEYLGQDTFTNLVNLTEIGLRHNKLNEIDDSLFMQNLHLKKMLLNNNTIKYLPSKFFDTLRHLEEVDLRDNPCVTIWLKSKEKLKEIKTYLKDCATNNQINQVMLNFHEYNDDKCKIRIPEDEDKRGTNEDYSIFDEFIFKLFFGVWR